MRQKKYIGDSIVCSGTGPVDWKNFRVFKKGRSESDMKKIVKIVMGVAAVGAVGVLVFARINKKEEPIEAVPDPVVQIQNPEMGTIELFTDLTGSVEPQDSAYVINKGVGEVLEVYVKQGDTVEKGQKLYKIDNKSLDAARISVNTAKLSLDNAQTNLNRMKVLYESGDISAQSYESTVNGVDMARLQYESAKLNYDVQAENTVVSAPIGGVLESFSVDVHDMMNSGGMAGMIAGEGSKSISFNVSERVHKGIKAGDPVEVEKNGTQYQGTITEVGNVVDQSSGLFKVKASLEGADALATGSIVKLYVTSEKAENVMTIPVDCVFHSNGQAYVFTYDPSGIVHRTDIEEGIISEKICQVESGLTYDDRVVTTWSNELYEGAAVKLLEEQGTTEETEAAK